MWAGNVLERCLCLQSGERLLIVVDQHLSGAGAHLAKEAYRLGAIQAAVYVADRLGLLPTPTSFDAGITLLSKLPPPGSAVAALRPGAWGRWLFGAPIDESILRHELAANYAEVAALTEQMARRLEGGRLVQVHTPLGTDLRFRIDGRPVLRDGGVVDRPGAVGNLPAGEAFVAPLESSAEGVLVVDLSITGRPLARPAELRFRQGTVVGATPGCEDLLGRRIGEFGIGTNSAARITGRTITDEKVLGTIHIGIGHNADWGGQNDDPFHVDCVAGGAAVWVDGRRIL